MISIVIPFYNEEDNIEMYEERFFPVMEELSGKYNDNFEYIFVDDGSSDDTLDKLNKIAETRDSVKVVPHITNKGVGVAMKTGISAAGGEYIISLDSDLTYRPEDIPLLLDAMRSRDCDCVSGSPYLKGEMVENVSIIKLIPSKIVNFLYKSILHTDITCFSGIFRIYKGEIFDKIVIESQTYDVFSEILVKMLFNNMKVIEVPVMLHKREFGESKLDTKKEIINNLKMFKRIILVKYFNKKWV